MPLYAATSAVARADLGHVVAAVSPLFDAWLRGADALRCVWLCWRQSEVDDDAMRAMFEDLDIDGNGVIGALLVGVEGYASLLGAPRADYVLAAFLIRMTARLRGVPCRLGAPERAPQQARLLIHVPRQIAMSCARVRATRTTS